jgi:hypothetical protein
MHDSLVSLGQVTFLTMPSPDTPHPDLLSQDLCPGPHQKQKEPVVTEWEEVRKGLGY